jgi:hypothetical protein
LIFPLPKRLGCAVPHLVWRVWWWNSRWRDRGGDGQDLRGNESEVETELVALCLCKLLEDSVMEWSPTLLHSCWAVWCWTRVLRTWVETRTVEHYLQRLKWLRIRVVSVGMSEHCHHHWLFMWRSRWWTRVGACHFVIGFVLLLLICCWFAVGLMLVWCWFAVDYGVLSGCERGHWKLSWRIYILFEDCFVFNWKTLFCRMRTSWQKDNVSTSFFHLSSQVPLSSLNRRNPWGLWIERSKLIL